MEVVIEEDVEGDKAWLCYRSTFHKVPKRWVLKS